MEHATLLSLLRLASPALPVGAFSYSRGLEHAVDAGWVHDEPSAGDWIAGVLEHTIAPLDGAVLLRAHACWRADDAAGALGWARLLFAARESRELQLEEHQMGLALARLLADLGVDAAAPLCGHAHASFSVLFALAAARWGAGAEAALAAYLWSAGEAQVSAALRLVPLGQTAGQRIASRLIELVPRAVVATAALADDEVGSLAPRLALGSALHEEQYSRLFRS